MHRGLTPVSSISAPGLACPATQPTLISKHTNQQHLVIETLRRIESENLRLKKELHSKETQISILCRQNEKLLNLPEGFALKNFLDHQHKKTQREKTIELILQLHKNCLSVSEITRYLEEKQVKTLSGRGRWHRGTINNILKRHI